MVARVTEALKTAEVLTRSPEPALFFVRGQQRKCFVPCLSHSGNGILMRNSVCLVGVCVLASVVSAYVVQSTPQLPDPGNTGVSKEQQVQLGQQVVAEVYKQMPVLPDSSPESQYV